MTKGLLVFVIRSTTDCTAGGLSARYDMFTLIGEGVPENSEPSERAPALLLHRRWAGTENEYLSCAPSEKPQGKLGPMMGGNFVYSSDSRFRRICSYPIPVHDRFETQQAYDANFE